MATPKQLVEKAAEILGISLATVIVHDRNLSTAVPFPLRTVAGRGRAAAKVTATDAANLLIAIAASESVKDSVTTVLRYRDLRGSNAVDSGIATYDALPGGHSFGEGLASLIRAASTGEISDSPNTKLKIFFRLPRPTAQIEWSINGNSSWTLYDEEVKWPARRTPHIIGDLERQATVTESTILFLGAAVGDLF